jgi:hypothetical protein
MAPHTRAVETYIGRNILLPHSLEIPFRYHTKAHCATPAGAPHLPLHSLASPFAFAFLFQGAGPRFHLSKTVLYERQRNPDFIFFLDKFVQSKAASTLL